MQIGPGKYEEVPGHKELTPNERAAILLQLGIMIQEVSGNYDLGVDVQEVIIRYLFPDCGPGDGKLDAMFADLDDIGQMIFDKDPDTQKWRLAIAWRKDQIK